MSDKRGKWTKDEHIIDVLFSNTNIICFVVLDLGGNMTGYEYIRNMPDTELSKTFMVGILAAVNIRNSTQEQMVQSEYVCPQLLSGKYECKCKESTHSCIQCRKEFLENEISL